MKKIHYDIKLDRLKKIEKARQELISFNVRERDRELERAKQSLKDNYKRLHATTIYTQESFNMYEYITDDKQHKETKNSVNMKKMSINEYRSNHTNTRNDPTKKWNWLPDDKTKYNPFNISLKIKKNVNANKTLQSIDIIEQDKFEMYDYLTGKNNVKKNN